jgi:Abortive infection C-terminus
VQISQSTIKAIAGIVTGDSKLSPYRKGWELEDFFTQFDKNKSHISFNSRATYAESFIKSFNGSRNIAKIIEASVDPRQYLDTDFSVEKTVAHLNQYLDYDGHKLIKVGKYFKLVNIANKVVPVDFQKHLDPSIDLHAFIIEQFDKCRNKIEQADYDGAITNSRALVEAVLKEVIRRLGKEVPDDKGDLNKLYKPIKSLLHLDPGQKDLSDTLKQILNGLIGIIAGLSGLSNKSGDRHSRTYKPKKHHAVLAVNASQTFCDFIFNTFAYQEK